MAAKLTPHQRIMRAARAGRGIRLSVDEVWLLACDDAIETRASEDDERARDPDGHDLWIAYTGTATPEERARLRALLVERGWFDA